VNAGQLLGRPPRSTSRAINSSFSNSRKEESRSIKTDPLEDRELQVCTTSIDDGTGASTSGVVHLLMAPRSNSLSGISHSNCNAAVAGPARGENITCDGEDEYCPICGGEQLTCFRVFFSSCDCSSL
jgi:hypothetical protein